MPTLNDALNHIGAENLSFQMLDHSTVSVKDKKRTKDTEITFATTETSADSFANKSDKVGFVVWVDRSDWQAALDDLI